MNEKRWLDLKFKELEKRNELTSFESEGLSSMIYISFDAEVAFPGVKWAIKWLTSCLAMIHHYYVQSL